MRDSALVITALSLFFFSTSARTRGSVPEDPLQDYLNLGDHEQAVELAEFKGISVLELDVNADGKVETFISADGYGGRLGNFWTVYLSRETGFERLSSPSKDLMFRPDMFYVGEIDMLDGRKIQGLLAYYPGKGGGDLAVYQLSNDYMVKTDLGSLNLENEGDRAFWDKYFAGPGEDQPYLSLVDHPVKHLTTKELAERGYDLSAVDQLNSIRESDPVSPRTPNVTALSSPVVSPSAPLAALTPQSGASKPTVSSMPPESKTGKSRGIPWVLFGSIVTFLAVGIVLWVRRRG